jgi:formate hydrogenlyase subunit 6/NADH:ubiquinone oxidoreductase subunit I
MIGDKPADELEPPHHSQGLAKDLLTAFRELRMGVSSVITALRVTLPYLKGGNSSDLRKEVTEQYPDPISSRTQDDLPARTRGLLYNDIERCTGCHDCEKVCPVKCITIESVEVPDSQKVWVSVFDIDYSSCTFCGLCVEACIPGSLTHTKAYERAALELEEMSASFGRGRITAEQKHRWEKAKRDTPGGPLYSLAGVIQESAARDKKSISKERKEEA